MSSSAKTAPYGSWKSPITSDLIVAQSISLSDVRLDGGKHLLAGRAPAGAGPLGRGARRQRTAAGSTSRRRPSTSAPACTNTAAARGPCGTGRLLLQFRRRPPLSPGAGRIRAAAVDAGAARARPAVAVRRRRDRSAPQPLDRRARGSHRSAGEPVNTIVAVDLGGGRDAGRVLASGHDFYASPRLSPDGNRLAWLAWDHPNMPWNGTHALPRRHRARWRAGRAAA